MRIAIAAVFLLVTGAVLQPAKAEPYAWCAIFSGDLGGVRSCSFFTMDQCRATVSGVGGFCQPNPWYAGAAPSDSRRNRRR
jgi:hypothetical protein